jgi:phosphatidylglycerophosphatase A
MTPQPPDDSATEPRPKGAVPYALATFFGCGYSPIAPGTAGSLAAIVIAIALHTYADSNRGTFLLLSAILLAPAIWSAGKVAEQESKKDPQIVVIDEVLGQWITLSGTTALNWKSYLAAFLLFRLFDIWKPPPVRQLEALPGGIGIVADDVMAGVYGALAIVLLDRFRFF